MCENIITWMRGAFASHLGFWLAVANWCEVLAALDRGVPSCRVSSRRLLNIFHFHFFMMYPKVRRSEVLLTTLPLAHTVGGPFPVQQSERAGVSASIQWCLLSFLCQFTLEVEKRNKRTPRRNQMKPQNWQACLGCLFSFPPEPQHISRRCWAESLGSQQPARSHPPASAAGDSCTRWQWVRGSHMPILGGRHKVPDCNICFRDKWRSSFERADRNKKARICANSWDWSLEESLCLGFII